MRLIDADRILQGYKDHDFIDTHIIYNAPTVDAIPVKWLEDRVSLFTEWGRDLAAQTIGNVIAVWRMYNRRYRNE